MFCTRESVPKSRSRFRRGLREAEAVGTPRADRTTDSSGEERTVPLRWRGGMLAWKAPCARAARGPVQVWEGCGGVRDVPRVTRDGPGVPGLYQCPRGGKRPVPSEGGVCYKSSGMEGAVLRCMERGHLPLERVAQGIIYPGFEQFQARGIPRRMPVPRHAHREELPPNT